MQVLTQSVSVIAQKCLLLVNGLFNSYGGIAAVSRLVIKALAELGYQIDVLVLSEKTSIIDPGYVDPARITYRTFGGDKIAFAWAAWARVLGTRYDLVIVDHINIAAVLAPLSRIGLARYLVWVYGVEVFSPRPDREGKLGLRNAWKRLAISQYTSEIVTGRFPGLSTVVCDLCLDPVRHPHELASAPPTDQPAIVLDSVNGRAAALESQMILHVGRMVPGTRDKGQESLLRSFPAVYQDFPGAQLVLAGDGADMPRLKAVARSLPENLQDRIFIPGYMADRALEQLYAACYLFAMPSIGEGFGLVYIEAMSHARPCLGAAVDATPYVVRDGVTGLLVENPQSAEEVAQKIKWMLARPEQASAMGLQGYQLVRSGYLFPHFRERFGRIVASV
jgi:phosphatidyl-myo-inositol dimannoside synthase